MPRVLMPGVHTVLPLQVLTRGNGKKRIIRWSKSKHYPRKLRHTVNAAALLGNIFIPVSVEVKSLQPKFALYISIF